MVERKAHIIVQDFTMGYGDFVLMRDLNFTIKHEDIFIIMGGSGCGKSTLMTILTGLKLPSKGRVFYGEIDFWGADPETRNQIIRRAGVMYQSGALWSSMTLAENISLPLETYTSLSPAEIGEVVELKLELVGLAGFGEFYPSEISGGMQKRAGIARAMALDPEILFFDEPSAGLDPVSARRLDDMILELRDSMGTTMVIVTHELAVGIGPVKVADYLDQTRIVTRTGDNNIDQAEFDQWTGSFKDNLINVLAENIGYLLRSDRITIHPWRSFMPIDYQVMVDIVRCDGELGKEVVLIARWNILRGEKQELTAMKRSDIRVEFTGGSYEALVAAQSRALGTLGSEIVQAIQTADQK